MTNLHVSASYISRLYLHTLISNQPTSRNISIIFTFFLDRFLHLSVYICWQTIRTCTFSCKLFLLNVILRKILLCHFYVVMPIFNSSVRWLNARTVRAHLSGSSRASCTALLVSKISSVIRSENTQGSPFAWASSATTGRPS